MLPIRNTSTQPRVYERPPTPEKKPEDERSPSVIIRLGQNRRPLLPTFRRAGSSALDAYRRNQVLAKHQENYLKHALTNRTRAAAEEAASQTDDPEGTLAMLTDNLDLATDDAADRGLRALAIIRAKADFGGVTDQLSRHVLDSGILDAQETLRSGRFIGSPPSIEIRMD